MTWHVYIAECQDGTYYTGITNDLERRMQEHKDGDGSKYVRSRGFKQLLQSVEVENKSAALKLEYKIKQLRRHKKKEGLRRYTS